RPRRHTTGSGPRPHRRRAVWHARPRPLPPRGHALIRYPLCRVLRLPHASGYPAGDRPADAAGASELLTPDRRRAYNPWDTARGGHMADSVKIDCNVEVPLRDGVRLRADVYRPDDAASHPVLLARLPYNKDLSLISLSLLSPIRAARRGYVVVIQDTRGRF